MLITAGRFQNVHNVDPLSMINVLFPSFWILLGAIAVLSWLTLQVAQGTRWLHLLLLCETALMLFYTPFLLSGYTWSPDSLLHGGIASYMPNILKGASLPSFGLYAESYPFSYLLTYCVEQVSGLNVFTYSLYIYPAIFTVAFTMLGYVFVSMLLNPRIAFASMILTLPALHYIEPHVSPFSAGTLLVLGALIALVMEDKTSKGILFFFIAANVFTHPISPLSLGLFFVAILLVRLIGRRFTPASEFQVPNNLFSKVSYGMVAFLGIAWFVWTTSWASSIYESVGITIRRVLTLSFLTQVERVSEFTTGGGFIYRNISLINEVVYAVFALFAVLVIVWHLGRWLLRKKETYLSLLSLLFAFSSVAFAGYAYALFLASGQRTLLGRGLLFFIYAGAISISLFLLKERTKIKTAIINVGTLLLIASLFVTFPIVSYSKEAYNTYTPSSGSGMVFISSFVNLSKYSISMSADQQLASYVDATKEVKLSDYPPELNVTTPSLVVLRINYFFVAAMRYDMSFQTNDYTVMKDILENDARYAKIYSDPASEAYFANR
jgi:hypothetical protein